MKKTFVIGSSVCDVIIRVHHLPQSQADENILNQIFSIGGCAYNVASILRYFHVPYTLFSPIGSGIYGDFVKQKFIENDIPILLETKQKNGCCYCLVDDSGERTFMCEHGAEYVFQKIWFSLLEQEEYEQVYICGLEIEEKTGDNIIEFLEHHPYMKIFFAPGPRINEISKDKIARLFALHPILHLNLNEILSFTQQNCLLDAVHALYQQTQHDIIVTLGEKGCSYFHDFQEIFIPAIKTEVVDTIGAGDSHIGTIIALQAMQKDMLESLTRANQIAAKIVSQQGATFQKIR